MNSRIQEQVLALLRLRLKWIAMLVGLSLPVAVIVCQRMPLPYLAEMRVFVDAPRLNATEDVNPGEGFEQVERDKVIATEKGLIDSYNVYKYVKSHSKDNPAPPSFIKRISTRIKLKIKKMIIGKADNELDESSDPEYQTFQGRVKFKAEAGGGFFSIGFSHRDPQVAINTTNLVFEGLVAFHQELQSAQKERLTKYIDKKLAEARENLNKAQTEINSFITSRGAPPPNEVATTATYKNLAKLQYELSAAEIDLKEKKTRFEQVSVTFRKLTGQDGVKQDGSNSPPRAMAALEEIKQLENALLGKSANYNPKLKRDLNNRLKKLYALLAKNSKNLVGLSPKALQRSVDVQLQDMMEAEARLKLAEEKYDSLKSQVDNLETILRKMPDVDAEYQKLLVKQTHYTRMIDTLTKYYVGVLARNDDSFSRLVAISKPLVNEKVTIQKKYLTFFVTWLVIFLGMVAAMIGRDVWLEMIVLSFQLSELPNVAYLGRFPRVPLEKEEANATDKLESNVAVSFFGKGLRKSLPPTNGVGNCLILSGKCPKVDRALFSLGLAGDLAVAGASVLLINTNYAKKDALRTLYPTNKRRYRTTKSLKELLNYLADEGKAGVTKGSVLFVSIHDAEEAEQKSGTAIPPALKKAVLGAKPYFDFIIVDTGSAPAPQVRSLMAEDCTLMFTCSEGSTPIKSVKRLIRSISLLGLRNVKYRSALITHRPLESVEEDGDEVTGVHTISKG